MKRESWIRTAFQKLFRNKLATVCFVILIIEFILIIFADKFAPIDPNLTNVADRLRPGFWDKMNPKYMPEHWLGTDELGRDVWSRLLHGGQVSLAVGFVATFIGLVFGTFFGLLAGYYKRLDNIIMRFMDVLFTFPGVLLALLIVAMLGVSTRNATIAISIWAIPSFARMIRGRVLQIKQEEYITAIQSLGATNFWIIAKHILINAMPTIIVIATMRIAGSILSIATLSFLGVGVPVPQAEWGGMISSAKTQMYKAPNLIIVPGIAIIITVICFNILGDKLRDILDPNLKD
ncbi:MAG: ABC transporter permease [Erysipelotrichaceae bacterium]|jgi:peptide/nickel transport system permease protein|nr:ABC transporter permease [Erysipelotrichaceae bacterium]